MIKDADMNQKELLISQSSTTAPHFNFWRRIYPSARTIGIVAVAAFIFFTLGCHNPAQGNMEAMIKHAQKQSSPKQLQTAIAGLCATNGSYIPVQNLPHEIL